MSERRSKAIATATVLGLGALGGVALGSNPGPAATVQQAGGGAGGATAAVVTSASGAAVPAAQTVAVHRATTTRAPVVTRASGSGSGAPVDD